MDEEVKKDFTSGPMISFRSARKFSSYLVKAQLYPLQRVNDWCKCNATFSNSVIHEAHRINYQFNNLNLNSI